MSQTSVATNSTVINKQNKKKKPNPKTPPNRKMSHNPVNSSHHDKQTKPKQATRIIIDLVSLMVHIRHRPLTLTASYIEHNQVHHFVWLKRKKINRNINQALFLIKHHPKFFLLSGHPFSSVDSMQYRFVCLRSRFDY